MGRICGSVVNGRKKAPKKYRIIAETLSKWFDENAEMLKVATGPGILAFLPAGHFKAITACDLSEEMVRVANRRLKGSGISNLVFKVQDAYDLPYPSGRFDIVLAANTPM